MSQTPPPLELIPAEPTPPSTTRPATFAADADAFLAWLVSIGDYIVLMANNVYDNCVDAYNSAVSAASSASSALAVAGATAWVNGGTYDVNTGAISQVDFQTYRKITASSVTTTDPSADPTNWVIISGTTLGGLGTLISSATGKAPLADADIFPVTDSTASNVIRKFTWADFKSRISTYILGTVNNFSAAQRAVIVELTDAATVALDLSLSNAYSLVIGGNRTLGVPTNAAAGQVFDIGIRQDATGSRTLAYAWPYVWFGTSVPLSTLACSLDLLVGSVRVWKSSTVTITIAAPGVVTWTAHGLVTGQRITLSTTGALPTGLTAGTVYYVAKIDANSFWLSTTLANSAVPTKIATSGSQSGVHTMTAATIMLSLNKGAV